MDRDELVRALTGGSPAYEACRSALLADAEFVVWDEAIPANELAASYRRRERFMAHSGTPTLGFAEAVEQLGAAGSAGLRLGQVEGVDPAYLFMLFVDGTEDRVVACLGVAELGGVRRRG
jgi:hypothetical protein